MSTFALSLALILAFSLAFTLRRARRGGVVVDRVRLVVVSGEFLEQVEREQLEPALVWTRPPQPAFTLSRELRAPRGVQ